MLPNSLKILGRFLETGPNDGAPNNRRIGPLTSDSGKVWVQVPTTAAALYVKFGGVAVGIDETSLSTELSAGTVKLEVGSSVVLDTAGNLYLDVYSASAWDVNVFEVS